MVYALGISSTESQVTVGLAVITIALLYFVYKKADAIQYPDGPMAFPILGNIPQIVAAGDLVKFLEKHRKIYGNVFTMEMGGVKRVVISGSKNMHYLLVQSADHTSTRSPQSMPLSFIEVAKTKPGLVWAPHPHWKTVRSFALNVLREEGMGKSAMEPKILTEIDQYINHFIEPNLGTPIDMKLSITYATSNIISQMAIGKRSDYEDPKLHRLNAAFSESFEALLKASITKNIPLITYLPGDLTGQKQDRKANDYILAELVEIVANARKNLDTEDQNNFLSQALLYARDKEEKRENTYLFTDGNIGIAALQLYGAGTETTATALRWALLYMIMYPHIQERVRKEILEVIGERQPSTKDRLSLPYTDAVISEVFRFGNIAPTSLPHTLDEEIVVEGKTIPAGAELIFNNTSIMNNSEYFPEPEKFKPDRFLGADSQTLKAKVLAFGIGRRACLGESLARMEFFLFFVSFLQKFKLSNPSTQTLTLTPEVALTRSPKQSNKIIFERC